MEYQRRRGKTFLQLQLLGAIAKQIDFPIKIENDLDFITRVAPQYDSKGKIKSKVLRFLAIHKKDDF